MPIIDLDSSCYGAEGKKPEGFYTCDYDSLELVKKLNYNLKKIKLESLFNESKKKRTLFLTMWSNSKNI